MNHEKRWLEWIAKALHESNAYVHRYVWVARALQTVAWLINFLVLFSYFRSGALTAPFALATLVSGFCMALGLWFSTFAKQWPTVSKYIDRQALEARRAQLRSREETKRGDDGGPNI